MNAMTHLNGKLSGKSLANDTFRGSVQFSGEIQGEDGAKEISGSITWKTLLPSSDHKISERKVLTMFVTRNEDGEIDKGSANFGRRIVLDCDFIALLASKDRKAQGDLLNRTLKESKRLKKYDVRQS